jgi:hypothetical protein
VLVDIVVLVERLFEETISWGNSKRHRKGREEELLTFAICTQAPTAAKAPKAMSSLFTLRSVPEQKVREQKKRTMPFAKRKVR